MIRTNVEHVNTYDNNFKIITVNYHHHNHHILYSPHLPCGAIFVIGLSSINDSVFIITGTLVTLHAELVVIHVSSFGTATTIHRAEADLAGVVSLTEGAAGTTTAGHVVAIHGICWTLTEAAWQKTKGEFWHHPWAGRVRPGDWHLKCAIVLSQDYHKCWTYCRW